MTTDTAICGYGGWLPKHPEIHKSFMRNLVNRSRQRARQYGQHEPSVAAFEKAIKDDPVMVSLFDQIFKQVQKPTGNQVTNFEELLSALDCIVIAAPAYEVARYPNGDVIGEPIGVPIYLVFDLLSNTAAAYDLFRMKAFNRAMKDLLNSWGTFLMGRGSNETLNTTEQGWFGKAGIKTLEANLGKLSFEQTFVCPDPAADNRGFKSWDAFFVRSSSLTSPHTAQNDPLPTSTIIYSACESTILRVGRNVQLHDKFWLKGQSYSLHDMLDGSRLDEGVDYVKDYIKPFVGGTVYQAFLGPTDYHRWHSPIAGTIVKIVKVPGSYYAVLPDAGAEEGDPDLDTGDPHGALIRSQAFLTVSATRVLFYIKSAIGLVCFIAVGMAEVSSGT
ncbi:phosphatidylserine decarboxylase [Suillus ampliporus]|nr:phosphatidylserine decarboxylase [Suillus ampliporus]